MLLSKVVVNGLTQQGMELLNHFSSGAGDRENPCFMPAGSRPLPRKPGPRVVVISLFDGIGAIMVALSRLQCKVVAYGSSEIDKSCKRLTRARWPGLIELGNVCNIDMAAMQRLCDAVKFDADLVIMGAGSPCQDLSQLKAGRQGLEGEKSRLFYEVPRVFELAQKVFKVPVLTFVENVASMSLDNINKFSEVLNCPAILIDAKHFTHCRRPRLFWASWRIVPEEGEELKEKQGWTEWSFPDCKGDVSDWLTAGCEWDGGRDQMLPTFTRPQRRTKPPYKPAGLDTASPAAITRWTNDQYFVQVYNYEDANMIKDKGMLRLPSLEEKEKLMGFDAGYISQSFGPKASCKEKELVGGQMIGNTFCVYPVMMLLHEALRQHGGERLRNHRQLVSIRGESPAGWTSYPRFLKQVSHSIHVEELVGHVLRHSDRGGTDVRLDVGVPFRTKAWPRSGLQTQLFEWAIIHGYKWKAEAHINCLELQAVINSIKWRLRKASNSNRRILHLVDSQVVAAILAKGRSSSVRLQVALSKYASLVIASGLIVAVGYIDTRDNPSDIPSRWAEL